MSTGRPEHGGAPGAAARRFGGDAADWLDLSTGINPVPFPLPPIAPGAWTRLPEPADEAALVAAARRFWAVPDSHGIVAAPGTSALIALLPRILPPGRVEIPGPTYAEHAAAFAAAGWAQGPGDLRVLVHPNNPDGRRWGAADVGPRGIVDESFADADACTLPHGPQITLKSFGKFWGLAGLRLGFAIAPLGLAYAIADALGPWPVSGPALAIGTAALDDPAWAAGARARLAAGAARLDRLLTEAGAGVIGGTALFRLAQVPDGRAVQARLAANRIWTRAFDHSPTWLRLGQPGDAAGWARLADALPGAIGT